MQESFHLRAKPFDPPRGKTGLGTMMLLVAVCLLLSYRLFALISNHAVNILYWDQWGFFEPMFDGKKWWQLFRYQHGPWRQGLGVISYLIADLTHWNSRIEALFIGGLVWLAMMAALWLKRRLFGKLTAYDIAIPLIVLTTAQFQTFAGPVSSAPTAFPLLLIVLYCLGWTVGQKLTRNALVLLFNFLLVYTGYGLLIGGITIALFAVECAKQRVDRRSFIAALSGLGVSVLTAYSFLTDYDLSHFNSSVQQGVTRVWEYPLFACFMFGRFVRLEPRTINWLTYLAMLCGIGLFILSVFALLLHLRRMASADWLRHRVSLIIVILLGYGLLFTLSTALGRAGMGLNVSQSSRFVTLMIPGFLGLYFHLLTLNHPGIRRFGLLCLLLLLLPGHLPLGLGESHPASYFSRNKRAWEECYLKTEDYGKCESMSEFKLLPAESPEELKRKLDYLKQHKLSLFADAQ